MSRSPRRYQLNKQATAIVKSGHPWLFREQLSSAAQVFADGDLLRLVDGDNQVVSDGVYASHGAVAIRAWGALLTPELLAKRIDTALERRASLAS